MKKQKIALFHPWLKSKGGAEKVVLEILKSKKYDIDIYTWVYDKENTFKEFQKFKINVIGPKIAKKLSRLHILRGLFLPISIFSKIPLEKYDKFLISTSGVGEFITFKNYKKGKTYAYIHTPLREASDEIVEWNLKNRHNNFLKKQIYLTAVKIYKIFEKKAWKKLDVIIFNSELSLKRAEEHKLLKNKKIKIVYPPIDVGKLNKLKIKKGNYLLYLSRINNPKRQDLLLKAWAEFIKKHPKEKLILAGNIENKKFFEKVQKLAKETKNVEIKINPNEKEVLELYKNCKAVVFVPYNEDFGMIPFEALALGKHLIAVNKGGFAKLIEKTPHYHQIKEKENEREMIKEINNAFEKFLKSKIKAKKIKNLGNNIHKFKKEIEKVLIQ